MKTSLRFLSKSFAFAALGVLAAAAPSLATDITFTANSNWSVAPPTLAGVPNSSPSNIIIYDLPTTGPYANSATATFDVRAKVANGGTALGAAGYGIIMQVPTASAVTFTTPNPNDNGDNNMSPALKTIINNSLSIRLGETNVPNFNGSNKSLGVIGLDPVAGHDSMITNGDGLFSVPFSVSPGAAGTAAPNVVFVDLEFGLGGNEYSGFAQSNGTLVTPSSAFPHTTNKIEIRRSRRGDTNGDLNVNAADIGSFIQVLNTGVAPYQSANPFLRVQYITDFDNTGATNAADIGGFIAALNGAPSPAAGPSAVPEPSTVALLCIGGGMLGVGALRRRKNRSNA